MSPDGLMEGRAGGVAEDDGEMPSGTSESLSSADELQSVCSDAQHLTHQAHCWLYVPNLLSPSVLLSLSIFMIEDTVGTNEIFPQN